MRVRTRLSLSFPYLSFYQVLDSFSGISLLLRPFSLSFSLWIRYLKPSSRVKCSPVSVRLQIIQYFCRLNKYQQRFRWSSLSHKIQHFSFRSSEFSIFTGWSLGLLESCSLHSLTCARLQGLVMRNFTRKPCFQR
jgi:hypothetical protein